MNTCSTEDARHHWRPTGRALSALAWVVVALSAMTWAQAGQDRSKDDQAPRHIETIRIWDHADSNTFPDLVHHRGQWLCILREGSGHVSPDGQVRLIASPDGRRWRSVKLFAMPSQDLREFEFTALPDGRLMILGAGCRISPQGHRQEHTTYVSFSEDGQTWTDLAAVTRTQDNIWMKRAISHDGRLYAMGYHCGLPRFSRLYVSEDGRSWETLVDQMVTEQFPNEAGLLMLADGRMLCLQRRDGQRPTALVGLAEPPFTEWQWQDTGLRTGRPTLLQLPDGRVLAPIRLLNPMRTTLSWIDPQAGQLTEALTLPSGGDGGYTGAVLRGRVLWVAYYSSHQERKSAIYLSRVHLPDARTP